MKIGTTRAAMMLLTGTCLAAFTGCTGGEGSCGNILTILAKLGPDKNIGSLSACEWQVLFAELPSVASTFGVDLQGVSLPQLTDAQAQAIVDFLAANGVTTLDSLILLVESGEIDLTDVPVELLELVLSMTGA